MLLQSFPFGKATEIHPLSKDGGLRVIEFKMSIAIDTRKCNLGSQQWLWFYVRFIVTLYYKTRQALLQNATTILSKNTPKAYKICSSYFYNKMPQLLLNMSILLQNSTVITKYDMYNKMPQYKHKNLRKQSNFFMQVLNAQLHFTINKFDTSTHVEGTIYQPIFLKSTHRT